MALAAQTPTYPSTRRATTLDTLHGVEVADPYRWLEALNSTETAEWIASQNRLSAHVTSPRCPSASRFKDRLTALWNYPARHAPDPPVQRRPLLPAKFGAPEAVRRPRPFVAVDPAQGHPRPERPLPRRYHRPLGVRPSPDARHLAYALSEGGADWQDVKIRRVRDGKDLDETLHWVRFSGLSWTRDGKGFFYSRFPAVAGD